MKLYTKHIPLIIIIIVVIPISSPIYGPSIATYATLLAGRCSW